MLSTEKEKKTISNTFIIGFNANKNQLNENKTSKFEWTLDNIRIEKIISVPIWATNIFFGRFQLY